jgi:hypothetical protein
VVESNNHYIATPAEIDSVVDRKIGRVGDIATAMYIDHYRPFGVVAQSRSPHIQIEAILADRTSWISYCARRRNLCRWIALGCAGAKLKSGAYPDPRLGRYRRHKATRGGVGSVGYSFENMDVIVDETAHLASVCGGDRTVI